jgi:hypothetical protein
MQWRHIGGLKVQLHLFLTSTLDGGGLLTSHPGHFSSLWENSVTQCIVEWVCCSASLDILEKRKISYSCQDSNPWSSKFKEHFVFNQVPYVSECKRTLLSHDLLIIIIIIQHICQGEIHLSKAKKTPIIIYWSSTLFQSSFNPCYFYSFIYFVFVNVELWQEKGVEGFFSAWEEKNSTKDRQKD